MRAQYIHSFKKMFKKCFVYHLHYYLICLKTCFYLFLGFFLSGLTQSVDTNEVNKTVEVFSYYSNGRMECFRGILTMFQPPSGCISEKLSCLPYREPLKYVCQDDCKVFPIHTYTYPAGRSGGFIVSYNVDFFGLMTMEVSWPALTYSGLYRCGLYAPSGLDEYREFKITGEELELL